MASTSEGQQLADLFFEITQSREPKFLLAVCDDGKQLRKLKQELRKDLERSNKIVSFIRADELRSDLLGRFYAESTKLRIDCVIVWGLDRIGLSGLESIFRELNFHRDALTALGIPIVIWISADNLRLLAAAAPDFWSRRTGVYYFAGASPRDLLKRLFSASTFGTTRLAPSPVAQTLQRLLASERRLSRCMRRKSVSIQEADDCLRHLHADLAALRNHVLDKRAIDVALWLWNVAGLDRDLQVMIERVNKEDRRIFEALYLDRNEALLYTAEQIGAILDEYGKQIDATVRKRKAPALVGIFRRNAGSKLDEIANDLDSYIGVSTTDLERWFDDSYEHPKEDPSDSLEKTFGAQASYELESWLSGYNDERPQFFSQEEGALLKALYSSSFPLEEISSEFRMTRSAAKKEIQRLEEKVRLFLSTAEKRKQAAVSRPSNFR
jgi:hypothetical protein